MPDKPLEPAPRDRAPPKEHNEVSVAQIRSRGTAEGSSDSDGEDVAIVSHRSSGFAVACAGFALISDGYQSGVMTMANVTLKAEYGKKAYNSTVSTRVSNALLVGAIIGQLSIGLVCDKVGRKAGIVVTTCLLILGSILATAAKADTVQGMFWFLVVARGVVGVGLGGEYPASSTSALEGADDRLAKRRGPVFIMVTNLMLCFGGPLACIIFLIVLSAAGENHLEVVWRVCFGIGIVFPLSVFYFRMKLLNSPLYRESAIKKRTPYVLGVKKYWRRLIGTCGAWFLYDFITFPNSIFSGLIISSIVGDGDIRKTAEWQLLLGIIALPGVFVGAYLCNKIGRTKTLCVGFSGYLVFGLIIGCAYDQITKIIPLFVIFYGIMQSMGNLGPGDMMGLTSVESYPTPIRGFAYGLSAAIGKAGAAIGTQSFMPIESHGKRWTFIAAACIGTLGVAVSWFFVPDMTHKDLKEQDDEFKAYLHEKGWSGEVGESVVQSAKF